MVEKLFREIEAQKFLLPITSPNGKKTAKLWITGNVRLLPFGIVEIVFPKEYEQKVLSTLDFDTKDVRYSIPKFLLKLVRKFMKCKKAEFIKLPKKEHFVWLYENVAMIPIGVRYDRLDFQVEQGEYIGWTHEAL